MFFTPESKFLVDDPDEIPLYRIVIVGLTGAAIANKRHGPCITCTVYVLPDACCQPNAIIDPAQTGRTDLGFGINTKHSGNDQQNIPAENNFKRLQG